MEGIRPMKAGDYEAAAALYEQVHQLHVRHRPDMYRGTYGLTRGEFDAMQGPGQLALVAEAGGEVAGLCAATVKQTADTPFLVPNRVAYVDVLCVAQSHRRQGIARRLWQAMVEETRALGIHRIELKVWQFNEEDLAFYRSVGMAPKYTALEMEV